MTKETTMSELRGYQRSISKAINITDVAIINEVEDIMRNDIFHSTLDWQSHEQFVQGAKEAYELYPFIMSLRNSTPYAIN